MCFTKRIPAPLAPSRRIQFGELQVGLVFRSVGYRGMPLADVPFNDKWGVILNEKGRVVDPTSKLPLARPIRVGLDQARTERRYRHEQTGFGRDSHVHVGGSAEERDTPSNANGGLGQHRQFGA